MTFHDAGRYGTPVNDGDRVYEHIVFGSSPEKARQTLRGILNRRNALRGYGESKATMAGPTTPVVEEAA